MMGNAIAILIQLHTCRISLSQSVLHPKAGSWSQISTLSDANTRNRSSGHEIKILMIQPSLSNAVIQTQVNEKSSRDSV